MAKLSLRETVQWCLDNHQHRSVNVGKCKLTLDSREGEILGLLGVRLEARDRGKGEAAQALSELFKAVDELGCVVMLQVQPMDMQTDFDRLVQLYTKFGFKEVKSNKHTTYFMMKRKPRKMRKPQSTKATGVTSMKLESISRHLAVVGMQHVMVVATNELDVSAVWKKIAAIFGHKPSIQIIDNEARGGHRLRVTFKNNVIDYGIWKNGIQVVDGMINSSCVNSVVERALKLIEAENELHKRINAKQAHSAFQKKEAVKTPDGWDAALDRFIDGVQRLEDKYITDNDYTHLKGTKISFEDAVKFTKVYIDEPSGNKRIYCFIDRNNGDILKPATYTVPARGSRGNIFDADHGMKRMGPHGPAYNK